MKNNSKIFDIIIIGSGIGGVSIGSELSKYLNVCIIEKERYLSYHSTGRSFAFFIESYGSELIRQLTTASKDFFLNNEKKIQILNKRGLLHIGNKNQINIVNDLFNDLIKINNNFQLLNKGETLKMLPCLKENYVVNSIYDSEASDIDVNSLYNIFLDKYKNNQSSVYKNIIINKLQNINGTWNIDTNEGLLKSNILINAGGAWCDEIAKYTGVKKIGLTPKKRTVFGFVPDNKLDLSNYWPLCVDIEENFYFKIENETVLASPADESITIPHDAQPDEIDIAVGADRIKNATNFNFNTIKNKWAGLRSFVYDKNPVIGFDPIIKNFFWYGALGGYGIQISPALAKIASNIILKKNNDFYTKKFNINLELLNIQRLYND